MSEKKKTENIEWITLYNLYLTTLNYGEYVGAIEYSLIDFVVYV